MIRGAPPSTRAFCALLAGYCLAVSGFSLEPLVSGAPARPDLAAAFAALAAVFALVGLLAGDSPAPAE